MNVPKNAYIVMLPKFLKKCFFCMLKPLSNMIGGRRRIMKSLTKWFERFVVYSSMLIDLRMRPAATPTKVVKPLSYRYRWPLFLKKCPPMIDNMSKKSIIRISVLSSIYMSV